MIGQTRISIAAWGATVLGAIVLVPVFSGPFLLTSMFICGMVTGAGILLQRWRVPGALVTVVQLLVLLELLAYGFLRDTLRYGLLPWKDTALAFNQNLVDAFAGIERFSAPLPPEAYFTFFASGVVGLTGLLVHLVAVQLRQAAWAGLLLLMMYTVPAATVHGGLPTLLFIPPALGYILLLSAEGRSRLTRWGRRIGGLSALDASSQVEASAAGQAGRRIGSTVILIAVLLPAMLPALPEGVLGNGIAGSGIGPSGKTVSLGGSNPPMLDMGRNLRRGENAVALHYTGDGPTHLRLTTLDQFDGNTWQSSPREQLYNVDGTFPTPPGLSSTDSIPQRKHHVNVTDWLRSAWVPVPYPTRELSIKGKWRYAFPTLEVASTNNRTVTGMKYTVTSYDVNPTEGVLRSAIETGPPDKYTSSVPQNTPDRVRTLAQTVAQSAKGNRYLQAAALQNWLRDTTRFTYSLDNNDGSGMRALEDFLFESRTGYCEQFATAMALMARTLGIPARVAIGFLPGTLDNGKWTVTMHDMHAWPELYFEGAGWVRFEPTPAVQSGAAPVWSIPTNPNPDDDPSVTPTAIPTSGDTEAPDKRNLGDPDRDRRADTGAGTTDTGGWWGGHAAVRWGTAGVGVLALALLPWLVRVLVRRRRFSRLPGRSAVEGLWAELRDTARDLGLDWKDSSTPRQTGAWLQTKLPPQVRPQAVLIARAVEHGRYAGVAPADVDLRAETAAIRSALVTAAPSVDRWRARLLPRSWRWYLSRGTSEASDLLDQFDLALARARSFLVPRRRPTT